VTFARSCSQALIDAYPNALSREELGARSGYSHTSGHFDNTLGRLRTLELATRGPEIRATEHLF